MRQTHEVERVTGIGGFFFKAADPVALSRWYAEHLGVGLPPASLEDDEAPDEEWYQEAGPTVFAPFGPEHWESPYLGPSGWGINFRVSDLDGFVEQLRASGIEVEVDPETYPNGRFASLHDPESNAIQLWQEA